MPTKPTCGCWKWDRYLGEYIHKVKRLDCADTWEDGSDPEYTYQFCPYCGAKAEEEE